MSRALGAWRRRYALGAGPPWVGQGALCHSLYMSLSLSVSLSLCLSLPFFVPRVGQGAHRQGRGNILHARNRRSEVPSEDAIETPLENSSENPQDK